MPKETSQRKQAESAEQIFSLIHGLIATLHHFYIPQVTFSEKSNFCPSDPQCMPDISKGADSRKAVCTFVSMSIPMILCKFRRWVIKSNPPLFGLAFDK